MKDQDGDSQILKEVKSYSGKVKFLIWLGLYFGITIFIVAILAELQLSLNSAYSPFITIITSLLLIAFTIFYAKYTRHRYDTKHGIYGAFALMFFFISASGVRESQHYTAETQSFINSEEYKNFATIVWDEYLQEHPEDSLGEAITDEEFAILVYNRSYRIKNLANDIWRYNYLSQVVSLPMLYCFIAWLILKIKYKSKKTDSLREIAKEVKNS